MNLKEELNTFLKEHIKEKPGHVGRCKFRATTNTFDIGKFKYVPLICTKCKRLGRKWIKIDLELHRQRFRKEFYMRPVMMNEPEKVFQPMFLNPRGIMTYGLT